VLSLGSFVAASTSSGVARGRKLLAELRARPNLPRRAQRWAISRQRVTLASAREDSSSFQTYGAPFELSGAAGRSKYAPRKKHTAPPNVAAFTIVTLTTSPVVGNVNAAIADAMNKIEPR